MQIVSSAPQIDDSEDRVLDVMHRQDHAAAFRYMIMALNTWARPEAITELSVARQVDSKLDTLDLNPPGRPQTKKVRPKIRSTDNLRGWPL